MKRIGLLVTILLLPTVCLAQDDSAEVEVTQISGSLYKLTVDEFVNIVALVGPDGVLLVDSGFPETAEKVRAVLRKLGSDRIRYIAHTHADYDHVAGNPVLGANATTLSHPKTRERLLELIDIRHPYFLDFPKQAVPSITSGEIVTIFFNSEEVILIPMAGGHTDTDMVVYFKQANVACLGDILTPDSFPVVKLDMGGDVETLIANIESLGERFPDDVTLVVGHGRDPTKKDLEGYSRMLHETTRTISEAMKSGKSCEDMKAENLLEAWANWSGTVFEEVDTDMWIETVCRYLSSNQEKNRGSATYHRRRCFYPRPCGTARRIM